MEDIKRNVDYSTDVRVFKDNEGRISLTSDYVSEKDKIGDIQIRIHLQNEGGTFFTTVGDLGELTAMADAFTEELAKKIRNGALKQIGYEQTIKGLPIPKS